MIDANIYPQVVLNHLDRHPIFWHRLRVSCGKI
jgi:hypothetical protein